MELVLKNITEQYEAVQSSRQALFEYCKTISPEDFVTENSSFGRGGSIRNLLVHIANVYEFWIANTVLKKNIQFTEYQSKQKIDEVIELFLSVDLFMKKFIELFRQEEPNKIQYEINGVTESASIVKLFTHVITHEFHHKGQILSISRQLGYTPVDTDIIR